MQAQSRIRTSQIAPTILTAITVFIHFQRALEDPDIRILFILNGLGYFALVAAFYLPAFQRFHRLVRWTFITYTALTILLYFVWSAKTVEAAMIILLLREP